jgi:hypothetical protein
VKLRTTDLSWQEVDDEIVILDLRSSSYLRLNHTGAALWRATAEGADESSLVALLVAEHGAPEDVAARDTRAFVEQLRAADLLEVG